MPSTITIPADTDLPRAMPGNTWDELNTWYAKNGVHTGQVTASRPVTMTDTHIDRWEIVPIDETGHPDHPNPSRNPSRTAGYQLADGQQWTTDDEFAVAIHHVITLITEPMPDDLQAALVEALEATR